MQNAKTVERTLFALGAGLLIGTASAATITLTGSDTAGSTSWNTGLHWSDKKAPSAGNDYVVSGSSMTLRTPDDTTTDKCPDFAGDSLTIRDGATLALKHNQAVDAVCKHWILENANVNVAWGDAGYNVRGDKMEIKGTNFFGVSCCARDALKRKSRRLWVRPPLYGDENAVACARKSSDTWENDCDEPARVKFVGYNANYKGRFELLRTNPAAGACVGTEYMYAIDFGYDNLADTTKGATPCMGAGVDSGDYLTMDDKTLLYARGLAFSARYPLRLMGDVRILLCGNGSAALSGRRGNESVWFGGGARITGNGSSVIDFRASSEANTGAVALGDVAITGVSKIVIESGCTFRVYPGYDNPTVPIECATIIADEADGLGPVTLKNGGFLSPGYGTQGIGTIGLASLTMEAGSYLYLSAAPGANGGTTNDFIRIGGDLANKTGGKIKVAFDALCTSMKPGDKLALLSAANLGGAGVTADDFELDSTVRITDDALDNSQLTGTFSIESVGGAKTLVFTQTSRQVVALVGQDTKGASCFSAASSGNAHWSNNLKPSADYDYIVPNGGLLRVNAGNYTFAGHSLSVLRGGCFGLDLTYATVGDLRLYGGAKVDARDQTKDNQTQSIKAAVTAYATKENPVTIENTGYLNNYPRYLEFRDGSTLKGEGDLRFQAAAGYVAQEPNSTTLLNWDASEFTGGIVITGRAARVSFKDEKAMGGPAPAFRSDRLRLEGNGQLACWGAYTMSDPTRGIYIGGGVTNEAMAVGGSIVVWSGPLVISNLISGTSTLRKLGSATLKLCCPTNSFSGQFAHKEGKLYICHKDTLAKAKLLQCYENEDPTKNPIWFIDTPEGMTVSSKDALCRDGGSTTAKFRVHLTAFDNRGSASTLSMPVFRVKGATLDDAAAIENWITLVDVPKSWSPTFKAERDETENTLVVSVEVRRSGLAVIVR